MAINNSEEVEREIEDIQKKSDAEPTTTSIQKFSQKNLWLLIMFAFAGFWVYTKEILPRDQFFFFAAIAAFFIFMSSKGTPAIISKEAAQSLARESCRRFYEKYKGQVPQIEVLPQCSLRRKRREGDSGGGNPMYWEIPLKVTTETKTLVYLFLLDPWYGRVNKVMIKHSGYWGTEKPDMTIVREMVLFK